MAKPLEPSRQTDVVWVLDVDDTLYAERDFVRSALAAAGRRAGELLGVGGVGEAAIRLFEAGRRGDLFQAALGEIGAPPAAPEQVAELVRAYREHRPERLPWFPDAEAVVRAHQAAGGRIAVITDGYLPTQRHKVEALGLPALASTIILSEELGRDAWKPSPRPYKAVMAAFEPRTHFIYVGDNPAKDFLSARALGWGTVRVRRTGTEHATKEAPSAEHAPEVEFTDFHALAAWWAGTYRLV